MAGPCPLCGAHNAVCGGQGQPVQSIEIREAAPTVRSDLKPYKINEGSDNETTLMLTDQDAELRGLPVAPDVVVVVEEPAEKVAPKPANKARTASNK